MNESNFCELPVEELTPLMLEDVPVFVGRVQAIVVFVICTMALILNFFIGMVISLTKSLRIRPFILCLQIPIINILQSLTRSLATVVTGIFHSWQFGEYGCRFFGFVSLYLDMSRWLLMFNITLDRFLSIFLPFKYPKVANWLVLVLSLIIWVCNFIYSFVPLIKFGCYAFNGTALTCSLLFGCTDASCALFFVITLGIVYSLGGIAPICMNVMMLYRAWKLRRSFTLGQFDGDQNQEHQQQITRRDVRAVVTFSALFVSFIGLTLPFFLYGFSTAITGAILEMEYVAPAAVRFLFRDIYYLITITDPLILSWNKDIKDAIKTRMKKLINVRQRRVSPSNTATSEPAQPAQD